MADWDCWSTATLQILPLTLVKTLTPKLGEKSGSKVAHCDPLMLGESPVILISWTSAC